MKNEINYVDIKNMNDENIQKYVEELVLCSKEDDLIKSIRTDYTKSGLDKEEYNDIKVDDIISGYISNDKFIEMADIYVSKYINYKRIKKIFKGSFVSIEYKNTYADNFKILDKTQIINQDMVVEYNNKFDKYFSTEFEIYKEPSKMLTADLKEFIADFREKYKIKFDISVKENKIYIRFFSGDMWKINLSKEHIDKMSIYKYYVITKFAKELVEKLNIM